MMIGKYRLEGGGMCPEQYDVFDGETMVGYLRLRHGHFRADANMGKETLAVYTGSPHGDGGFDDDEREHYLLQAIAAIDNARRLYDKSNPKPNPPTVP